METELIIFAESQAPSDSRRERLISEWLFKFSLAFQSQGREPAVTRETAPMLAAIWAQALADIPLDALEACFQSTLQSARFFPTVADIRSHFDAGESARAEDEWQRVLEYCRRFVFRDLGMAGQPRLPADIDHAVRAAGGLYFVKKCSKEDLQWAKKRFLEDLARQRKAGSIAPLLGPSPLAELLGKVATRRQLPYRSARELADGRETVSVVSIEDAKQRIMAGSTATEKPSNDSGLRSLRDWAERRYARESEPVLAKWREAHGIPKTPAPAHAQPVDSQRAANATGELPKTSVSGGQP